MSDLTPADRAALRQVAESLDRQRDADGSITPAGPLRIPSGAAILALLDIADERDRLQRDNAELTALVTAACDVLCCCPPLGDAGCGCRAATPAELATAMKEDRDRLRAALDACDMVMDTAGILGLPQQLPDVYRDSWARAHIAARAALAATPAEAS